MGYAGSWIAVKCAREAALERLGLPTGAELDPHVLPRGLAVGDLPGGWVLFLSSDFDEAFTPQFTGLSELGPAVACAVEEHVMYQEARGFAGGRETWRVTHNSEKGIFHLDVSGEPPPELEAIRREAFESQESEGGEDADVDLVAEVPLGLARTICGFKHDEDSWPESLTALVRPGSESPKRVGFLQRLFGRG